MLKSDARIRIACPADIPSIVALEREAPTAAHWPESSYRGIFDEGVPARVLLVVADEGVLLGFVLGRIVGDECELENIVVAEGSRRRGIGSRLIPALMNTARERKANRIFLEVRESNAGARALYEKCVFAITGRRKSYYTDPVEDAVLYTLAL